MQSWTTQPAADDCFVIIGGSSFSLGASAAAAMRATEGEMARAVSYASTGPDGLIDAVVATQAAKLDEEIAGKLSRVQDEIFAGALDMLA